MSDGNFFTFPLSVLAMPLDHKEIMQHAVDLALARAGEGGNAKSIDGNRIRAYVAEHKTRGYDRRWELHDQLIRGAIVCNVDIHSMTASVNRFQAATSFVQQHEGQHGTSPLVFISGQLFWGCHDRDDPPWREFSVLCGINSIIGFKRFPVLIRRGLIVARQLGFKSGAVMAAELAKPDNTRKPLSTRELRTLLDTLEEKGLIARCQASRRNVYFQTLVPPGELRDAVKGIVHEKSKIALRREADRQELEAAAGRNGQGTVRRPLGDHSATT